MVREARKQGLKVPIIFMGYLNPMLAYGFDKLAAETKEAGADGFIIVDLPVRHGPAVACFLCQSLTFLMLQGEESHSIISALNTNGLSYIPLVTPATKSERIAKLAALATGFVSVACGSGLAVRWGSLSIGIGIASRLLVSQGSGPPFRLLCLIFSAEYASTQASL